MQHDFGLYSIVRPYETLIFKINYATGKTWQFLGGAWIAIAEAP